MRARCRADGAAPTPGRFTAAFAARGLGALKAQPAAAPLARHRRPGGSATRRSSSRRSARLPRSATPRRVPCSRRSWPRTNGDPTLRLEAATALAAHPQPPTSLDFIIDLLSDPAPGIRGAAMRALAAIDPETFLTDAVGPGSRPRLDGPGRAGGGARDAARRRRARRDWSPCSRTAISGSSPRSCARWSRPKAPDAERILTRSPEGG